MYKTSPTGNDGGHDPESSPSPLHQEGTGRDGLMGFSSFIQAVGAELGEGAAYAPSCKAGLLPAAHSLKGALYLHPMT